MSQLAIIADDLTGAADAGAPFAQAGFHTVLSLGSGSPRPDDVLVISTNSRHLPPDAAYTQVYQASARFQHTPLVYKKMDSTLRGHPGAELGAVMDALQASLALVAPAFPAQMRTTVGGRQHVGGLPLEQTPFATDVASSDISVALSERSAAVSAAPYRTISNIPLATVRLGPAALCAYLRRTGIMVADAETDDDLAILAQAALLCRLPLLCGSAGLARALVGVMPPPESPVILPLAQRASGPVLVVAGSRHPRTRRQVYATGDGGAELITPHADVLAGRLAFDRLVDAVAASLNSGRHTVLTTVDMGDAPVGGEAIANMLASVVRQAGLRSRIGALILTGGDTAAAILTELKAEAIWLQGEMDSGIPWGLLQGGVLPGVPVVTKAGGFGHDDTLAEAIEFLAPVHV